MKTILKAVLIFSALLCINVSTQGQAVNLSWVKQLAGTDYEYGLSIAADASGNVFITGYFSGTTDFDPGANVFSMTSAGGNDIFVAKYDATGSLTWVRQFGGSDADRGLSIAIDASGNVYTTGYFVATVDFDPGPGTFNLASPNSESNFISKLDASGSFIWARQWQSSTADCEGAAIAIDAYGNVVTAGFFKSSTDFNPGEGTFILHPVGGADIFVSKLNSNGEFIWAKQMGGTGTDLVNDIDLDGPGNIYITGYFSETGDYNPGTGTNNLVSIGNSDMFFVKLSLNGEFLWGKSMGSPDYDYGYAIVPDGSGNVYATGTFQGTVDFDPGSGILNLTSGGTRNVFVLKFGPSGDLTWAKQFNGNGTDYSRSIALDKSGKVYITGSFKGTIDFDPGLATSNFPSAGDSDCYIVKLDSNGNLIRANQFGGTGPETGIAITVDAAGIIYTTGVFTAPVDFDPGSAVISFMPKGATDIFLHKMSQNLSGIYDPLSLNNLTIYPNPNSGLVQITSEITLNNACVRVFNMQGILISEQINMTGYQFSINLLNQECGMYIIEVINSNTIIRKKLIKQ